MLANTERMRSRSDNYLDNYLLSIQASPTAEPAGEMGCSRIRTYQVNCAIIGKTTESSSKGRFIN